MHKFAPGFNPVNFQIVGRKNGPGSSEMATWQADFNGKTYFHLREIYDYKGMGWAPGKGGFSVLRENAKEILTKALEGV